MCDNLFKVILYKICWLSVTKIYISKVPIELRREEYMKHPTWIKWATFTVVVLFIGLAFTQSINANVSKHDLEISLEENINQKETLYQRITESAKEIGYLYKISDEDCGCDEDSSELEWSFPVLCNLLMPLVWVLWGLVFISLIVFDDPPFYIFFPYLTLVDIGIKLNCWWV